MLFSPIHRQKKVSIEALMKENTLVVRQKFDIQNRNGTKLNAVFGHFGPQKQYSLEQKTQTFTGRSQ